ncbi:PorT family protein [Cyclobacteriaceae bacterium]|nr:PorT family protein [Cyclobacteriaceae bacterium]
MKKVLGVIFVSVLFINSSFSQGNKYLNLPNYDDKPIHYGFHLSVNHTAYRPVHSDWFIENDTVSYLNGSGNTGFGLGFIFNFRLFKYGDFRILPTVAFYTRTLEYGLKGSSEPVTATIQSSYVDIPLLFKYKAKRRSNARAYMIGGIKTGFEVGGKKKRKNDDEFVIQSFDLSLEYGVGLDLYYPYFKFAPELRFSLGLTNMMDPTNSIYSNSIDRLSTYTVSLFINFE